MIAKILAAPLYAMAWCLGWGVSRLPWSWRQLLARILSKIWFHLLPFRRRIILHNLALVFPRSSQESMADFQARCEGLTRRNMFSNVLFILEFLERFHWTPANLKGRVHFTGWENIETLHARGTGFFVLSAHIGNWELMTVAGALRGLKLSIVTRYLRNPIFDWLWVWSRRRFGLELLAESGSGRGIVRAVRQGRVVGFILDQHTGPPHGLETQFLGRPAWSPKGLAILSTRLQAPIVPAYLLREADGSFRVHIEAPLDFGEWERTRGESGPLTAMELESHVRRCNQVLEGWVRQHAEQYLWLHKRFKNFVDYRSRLPWEL